MSPQKSIKKDQILKRGYGDRKRVRKRKRERLEDATFGLNIEEVVMSHGKTVLPTASSRNTVLLIHWF